MLQYKRIILLIESYELWKRLTLKIKKHIFNINLYINDYLAYSEVTKMRDGISILYMFLDDLLKKSLWSYKTSIMNNTANIKKFYQCMSEKG